MFKKKYHYAAMVQFDENNKPCICGIKCLWFDTVIIESYFYRSALKKAYKLMENKYPEYKGFIQF